LSRRPAILFRGSELPRLLLLAAIVLAGWPMILLFAGGREDPKPPPTALPAEKIEPVVPESGIEFQALVDKAPMRGRENAAYSILLRKARETPEKTLATEARRDLFWTHLWERPANYRGVPVHLEATARRILSYEVNPELAPEGRIYEAWVYSDENRSDPYVLVFEDPPAGLVLGPDLNVRLTFDGYFLKLLGYRAGDTFRAAPMLVGRLHVTPAQPAAPAPMVELRNMSKRDGFVLVFVLLFAYVVIRGVFQVRKFLRPGRASAATQRSLINDEIAPEDLTDWLRSVPDEGSDDDPPHDSDGPARPRP